jgi:hypothetical protein
MSWKGFVTAAVLCILAAPAFAAPELNIIKKGVQANHWVWEVDITPDLVLANGSTPLALELGFRLTGAPLLSATNINPSEFDTPNPGKPIFGWETLDPAANNKPVGLQVNTGTGEIFAAYGSINFSNPGTKPFLQIVTQGPPTFSSSTIQWLGAYALGHGRIAQIVGTFAVNFDDYFGTATQAIPEPMSGALLFIGAVGLASGTTRRRRAPLL